MYIVKTHPNFDAWLEGIKDRVARLRLSRRLDKAQQGNLGDIKPVGDGIFEMREHFGPGWRMYYVQRGRILVGRRLTRSSNLELPRQKLTG